MNPLTLCVEVLSDIRLITSYQLKTPPTDQEWDRYLNAVKASLDSSTSYRFLVVTEGAYPSRPQQARLIKLVRGHRSRVSVISPSPVLRFVVSVLALMNPHINCYLPSQISEAFRHLKLEGREHDIAQACIERLQRRMTAESDTAVSAM